MNRYDNLISLLDTLINVYDSHQITKQYLLWKGLTADHSYYYNDSYILPIIVIDSVKKINVITSTLNYFMPTVISKLITEYIPLKTIYLHFGEDNKNNFLH